MGDVAMSVPVIRAFTEQWPSWVGIGFSPEKNSQKHYKLSNGSEVKAVATSKDALRGFTPTILVFDEAAFIEADSDFWAACMASLSTGGKVIVVSTPNGYDPIYYEIYDQALRNMNDFKISEMYWFRDPRYTKDLYLVKTQDIIHYLLNKEEYTDADILSWEGIPFPERNYDDLKAIMDTGYKPCSIWFEGMVKKLKYDKRKVSQELECNFLGSGDNVFDSNMLQKIQQSIQEAQSRGYKLGEYFNAVIIPSHLLEEFEKDLEAHLINNTNDSRTTVFGLEVLICGKNEQIRFGKIF